LAEKKKTAGGEWFPGARNAKKSAGLKKSPKKGGGKKKGGGIGLLRSKKCSYNVHGEWGTTSASVSGEKV